MSSPKVSVIVPNFNHRDHLRQRLDTVLNQTYRDFEVIILDDCSTDGSVRVIQDYRSHPLVSHVIVNSKNSGSPFAQWKRGTELARGEWIWFAESDDYASLEFLETMLNSVRQHNDVGLIYCDSVVVNDADKLEGTFSELKNKRFATKRWSTDYSNTGLAELEEYVLPAGTINNASAVLFSRRLLLETNPFDRPLRYIGDKYAFVKVLSRSNVYVCGKGTQLLSRPIQHQARRQIPFYFYEQFLVFDWALRNLPIADRKRFYSGFHSNTKNSLFRGWNRLKLRLYGRLLKQNPALLVRSCLFNLGEAVRSRRSGLKHA
ncbi:MAG: glycosyltransferase family 2 protein [Bacteroidia bacterium]|nr:glycosyltransferase family 2 protein [Bacteroidia bacterium]